MQNVFSLFCVIRSSGLMNGYMAELDLRADEITKHKLVLEGLYMSETTDEQVLHSPELKQQYDQAVQMADKFFQALCNTLKTVKLAVEPWLSLYHVWLCANFS